jgi:poly-gamma-glutamate synthesis protein (capsule biosynthesis protein)
MRGRHLDGLALRCSIAGKKLAGIELLPVRRNEHNDICVHGAETVAGKEILNRFEQLSLRLGKTVALSAGNYLEIGSGQQASATPGRVLASA